jgi:hypothetical protein
MSITKPTGDMYDHFDNLMLWKAITGKCGFGCGYCSTRAIVEERFNNILGPPKLHKPFPNLKSGYTWFVCSTIDMFHRDILDSWIDEILNYMIQYPGNNYLLQSKDAHRLASRTKLYNIERYILATTIESDITYEIYDDMGYKDWQNQKIIAMAWLKRLGYKTMITIEPIMKFNLNKFFEMFLCARPDIITIGADSKNSGLPEPTWQEVAKLIEALEKAGLKVVQKKNLERLRRKG